MLGIPCSGTFAQAVAPRPPGAPQGPPEPALHFNFQDIPNSGNEPEMYRETQLFRNPDVRRELGLTHEQGDRWGRALAEVEKETISVRARISEAHAYRRSKPAAQRDPATEERLGEQAMVAQAEYLEIVEDRLLKVLTPPQRDRSKQLQLQAQGPMAFRRADLQQQLSMDEGQVRAVLAILDDGYKKMREFQVAEVKARKLDPVGAQAFAEARTREIRALASRLTKDVMDLLRENQRTTYRLMLGAPFDFARPLS